MWLNLVNQGKSNNNYNTHLPCVCVCVCASSGVNAMLRKMAAAAAAKPHVEIKQDGERFYIRTSTTIRTTEIDFVVGEEFNEETVDGRKCKVGWATQWLVVIIMV